MRHISIKLDTPCEFVNVTPVNPLISKCQIKVCYVGDEPNRNRSVITKEVARKMANSLPGSPIVGFYNEATEDFEEHNRIIDISNGKFEIKDTTRPYGFVDMNAKVWFQKFLDDGVNEHEYLMTEGYIWTGAYPESKRIISEGNNQSMELSNDYLDATWSEDDNGDPQFFIINEAIVEKLCILGNDCEPCFEGSQITEVKFSFSEGFENRLFSMMNEMKALLKEGGAEMNENTENVVLDPETVEAEKVLENQDKENQDNTNENDNNVEDPKTENPAEPAATEDVKVTEEPAKEEPVVPEENPAEPEVKENEPEPAAYNLEEIPEYVELKSQFDELQEKYNALEAEKADLDAEVAPLKEFKLAAEKKDKEAMIAQFYMLSDEDKADVIANIDTYSIDDIEAKLSIICVRNKVSFDLDENKDSKNCPTTFNLNSTEVDDSATPAWVKAALATKQRN